jgi:very-short-patch-repair endonuclease
MPFLYNNALIEKAKELRMNMTPEEKKLWFDFLREYPIRFLRQKVIGDYILDFYCAKVRLCIELDGNQHLSIGNVEHDAIRTGKLSQLGITTIRFSNEQVNLNFSEVCKDIELKVNELIIS